MATIDEQLADLARQRNAANPMQMPSGYGMSEPYGAPRPVGSATTRVPPVSQAARAGVGKARPSALSRVSANVLARRQQAPVGVGMIGRGLGAAALLTHSGEAGSAADDAWFAAARNLPKDASGQPVFPSDFPRLVPQVAPQPAVAPVAPQPAVAPATPVAAAKPGTSGAQDQAAPEYVRQAAQPSTRGAPNLPAYSPGMVAAGLREGGGWGEGYYDSGMQKGYSPALMSAANANIRAGGTAGGIGDGRTPERIDTGYGDVYRVGKNAFAGVGTGPSALEQARQKSWADEMYQKTGLRNPQLANRVALGLVPPEEVKLAYAQQVAADQNAAAIEQQKIQAQGGVEQQRVAAGAKAAAVPEKPVYEQTTTQLDPTTQTTTVTKTPVYRAQAYEQYVQAYKKAKTPEEQAAVNDEARARGIIK